jgi:hypothetical protein
MSEWRELTWDDAMQRGYEAFVGGEALYEEIDAEQGRSNIDIEKHLRRAELKLAQVHAWLAMARELAGNETTPAVGRLAEHRSCRLRPQTGGGRVSRVDAGGLATTVLVAGLRGSATPTAPGGLPAAGRVWLTRFRCGGTVHGSMTTALPEPDVQLHCVRRRSPDAGTA